MREIILVHLTGEDRPGLTATMAKTLAQYDVDILDIGQAVIHDTLSLGILIRIPPKSESAPILKDLLFVAHSLNVDLKFTPVGGKEYGQWAASAGKDRHIVTLLGTTITARALYELTTILWENGLNIDIMTRLTGRLALDQNGAADRSCVELSVRGEPKDVSAVRKAFLRISSELGVDISFQEDNSFRRNRRLIVFDMDSTLIAGEVIDELAVEAGVGSEVSKITESAMRGEIDFQESLRRRLGLLKGVTQEQMDAVAKRIPLNDGAERLISTLRRFGMKTAIISGGFTYFGKSLQKLLGVDYMYANELEMNDGVLTGRVLGDIVDGPRKAAILAEIAERENISLQQVVAVGDGANDLPMLNLAGLGIAYHAKPLVKEGAGHSISTHGLDSILYLLGMSDRDIIT